MRGSILEPVDDTKRFEVIYLGRLQGSFETLEEAIFFRSALGGGYIRDSDQVGKFEPNRQI